MVFLTGKKLEKRWRVRYIITNGVRPHVGFRFRKMFPYLQTTQITKGEKNMKAKLLLLAGAVSALALASTSCQSSSKSVVYDGVDLEPCGNPIFTDAWTCDPAPLVVGDRLYVYTGEDIYKDGENIGLPGNYNIADWRVYSTDDMVH